MVDRNEQCSVVMKTQTQIDRSYFSSAHTDEDLTVSVLQVMQMENHFFDLEWTVDGIVQTSTSDTLTSSNLKDQTVIVSVTLDNRERAPFPVVVVQNSPPNLLRSLSIRSPPLTQTISLVPLIIFLLM